MGALSCPLGHEPPHGCVNIRLYRLATHRTGPRHPSRTPGRPRGRLPVRGQPVLADPPERVGHPSTPAHPANPRGGLGAVIDNAAPQESAPSEIIPMVRSFFVTGMTSSGSTTPSMNTPLPNDQEPKPFGTKMGPFAASQSGANQGIRDHANRPCFPVNHPENPVIAWKFAFF